ncbi:hypothetical protein GCM10023206_14630 [Acinetobacter puyangensis]|uniref:Uncharacterized protein n=1 Tax=Acinetobacter puyangensis TaxID=1096779 RepID=A0A240E7U3_9GAMM|nr:hypothetical protein [Acinetobacter puyangensis]SNX44818.1 hypothetical protein SAMN05421731_104177 [Acinetobacter puyangensis]
MSLNFTHKPNYFFFAQTLVNFLVNKIEKKPDVEFIFPLADIYDVFQQDFAATTSNLEGILNIADNYHVGANDPEHRLIASFKIDAEANTISFKLNEKAVQAVHQGQPVIAPDAHIYE